MLLALHLNSSQLVHCADEPLFRASSLEAQRSVRFTSRARSICTCVDGKASSNVRAALITLNSADLSHSLVHCPLTDALQYGYTVVIAFTFGESDLYRSLRVMRPLNLWLVKRFGFVLPIFAGCWWCPLLPRTDVQLHTVRSLCSSDVAFL